MQSGKFSENAKHGKITKIEYKTETKENRGKQRFGDSEEKNQRKKVFWDIFK